MIARASIDVGNVLFGDNRFTSVARLSKVAYTVPARRPPSSVSGSAVGASDVVAISGRARYIQNLTSSEEWDRGKKRLDGPNPRL